MTRDHASKRILLSMNWARMETCWATAHSIKWRQLRSLTCKHHEARWLIKIYHRGSQTSLRCNLNSRPASALPTRFFTAFLQPSKVDKNRDLQLLPFTDSQQPRCLEKKNFCKGAVRLRVAEWLNCLAKNRKRAKNTSINKCLNPLPSGTTSLLSKGCRVDRFSLILWFSCSSKCTCQPLFSEIALSLSHSVFE